MGRSSGQNRSREPAKICWFERLGAGEHHATVIDARLGEILKGSGNRTHIESHEDEPLFGGRGEQLEIIPTTQSASPPILERQRINAAQLQRGGQPGI